MERLPATNEADGEERIAYFAALVGMDRLEPALKRLSAAEAAAVRKAAMRKIAPARVAAIRQSMLLDLAPVVQTFRQSRRNKGWLA